MQEAKKGLIVQVLSNINELLLLRDVNVRLAFYKVKVRAHKTQSGFAKFSGTFTAKEFLPECMAGEARWQRLYEHSVLIPQQVQARIFCYDNLSSADDLFMQCGYVVTSLGGNEPKERVESVQMIMTEVTF